MIPCRTRLFSFFGPVCWAPSLAWFFVDVFLPTRVEIVYFFPPFSLLFFACYYFCFRYLRFIFFLIQGVVFSPIPYQLDDSASASPERGVEVLPVNCLSKLLEAVSFVPVKRFLATNDVKLLPNVDLTSLSWHPKKDLLAFASARNQVTIHDYGDSGEGKEPCILMNDLQREVKVLEWRPNAGKTLSVACNLVYSIFIFCGAVYASGLLRILETLRV